MIALSLVTAALVGRQIKPGGPNVLLIVVDTLRADHLGVYGYERPTSPSLDAFAADGVRFARAYSSSSWTGASVASILTGLYPEVHGLKLHSSVLSSHTPRLARAFHDAGYDTAAISANPAFVTREVGFGDGFRRFELLHGGVTTADDPADQIWSNPDMTEIVRVATADKVTDAALRWIRNRRGAPFFLYAHYFDPHAAYMPPPDYARKFGVDPSTPLAGPLQRVVTSGRAPKDPADLATLTALYDGEIAFTDAEIGRLLRELAATVAAPTIVVVTADHGEEFGDHGGMQHSRTLFEDQVHVPLIVAHFGFAGGASDADHLPPGSVIAAPFSLVDLWALLAGLTGIAAPPGAAPLTLVDLAEARETKPVYADLSVPGRLHRWAEITGPWKLLVQRDRTIALYDVAADPHERTNRLGDQPLRARGMRAALAARNAACAAQRRGVAPVETPALTDERRERLRALGYLR